MLGTYARRTVWLCVVSLLLLTLSQCAGPGSGESEIVIREIESGVDHNHCTTRQFQHMVFHHEGTWFAFYSDGKHFRYQTSRDAGATWLREDVPVDQAPNGSTSFDVLRAGPTVYVAHARYPLGRYDPDAPYARDPARRHEYTTEGCVKKGRIEGRAIRWLEDRDPGFTPDYTNLVRDAAGHIWVFHREQQQVVAHRSLRPDSIESWTPVMACLAVRGRHAPDAAALDDGRLYVASVLTTDGTLYGNLYDGEEWTPEPVLLSSNMTTVAGDDRRLAMEFDPARRELHLVYVDAGNTLRHRRLSAPYQPDDWDPRISSPGREIAANVFTCALSIDTSATTPPLVITYGVEQHLGEDRRVRTGALYARRFDGNEWRGNAVLLTRPGEIHNWYPNVNQDASAGLCLMYSRSMDPNNLGTPLAVMVSIRSPF